MALDLPWLVAILERVFEFVLRFTTDNDAVDVFKGLIAFFGG